MGLFRNPHEFAHQMGVWSPAGRMEQSNRPLRVSLATYSANTQSKMEASMYALQATAVVAVLVVGFGASLVVFPATEANRGRVQSASVKSINFDHQNASNLLVEKIHDMTFVDPPKD